jgi:hypothetical protein
VSSVLCSPGSTTSSVIYGRGLGVTDDELAELKANGVI